MKNWKILETIKDDITPESLIDVLLKNRGITPQERQAFLKPEINSLTLDSVGIDTKQVAKATKRIIQAIDKKEHIVVYGDYDVDGITASAIIWETLHDMGASIMPYIPSRMSEGYGLSIKGITNLVSSMPETKVIITVDNGIVAHEAVDFANEKGIDVIITDHHVASTEKKSLNAYSVVHTTKLCGAGVAWMFTNSIREHVLGVKYDLQHDRHLELATLGTVADLVPLVGANRTIVTFGLKKLCSTIRPGLLALLDEAACDQTTLSVYHIGHIIAPRLNATGRIEHGMDSLRLLCTKDKKRAYELAMKLGHVNRERQTIMRNASDDAVEKFRLEKNIRKLLIIDHEEYQEGVIGLVAGKLVEEFYRPSIVISRKEKLSKGSVRSIAGFNIIEFLRTHGAEHFVNVGGHPMAAGFTIETDKIVLLKNILELKADELLTDELLQRTLMIDCVIPFSAITKETYTALQRLQPFGMSNFEPVFMTESVILRDIRKIGKEGQHLRILLEQDNKRFEAVAFGIGERVTEFKEGEKVNVAYTIDENTWNGNTKLQLKIKDIKNN